MSVLITQFNYPNLLSYRTEILLMSAQPQNNGFRCEKWLPKMGETDVLHMKIIIAVNVWVNVSHNTGELKILHTYNIDLLFKIDGLLIARFLLMPVIKVGARKDKTLVNDVAVVFLESFSCNAL